LGGEEEGLLESELEVYCVLGEQLCYEGVQGQPRFVVIGGYYGFRRTEALRLVRTLLKYLLPSQAKYPVNCRRQTRATVTRLLKRALGKDHCKCGVVTLRMWIGCTSLQFMLTLMEYEQSDQCLVGREVLALRSDVNHAAVG
jgi:hypothetical protein